MNCENWQEPIALLVDGEPSSDALAHHLSQCSECRALLAGLRADQALLRAPATDEPAVRLIPARVHAKLRARRRIAWSAAAAAVAATVLLTFYWPKTAPVADTPVASHPVARHPVTATPPPPSPVVVAKAKPAPLRRRPAPKPPALDWEAFLAEFSPPPEPAPTPPAPHLEAGVRIPTSNPDVIILMLEPDTAPQPQDHGGPHD